MLRVGSRNKEVGISWLADGFALVNLDLTNFWHTSDSSRDGLNWRNDNLMLVNAMANQAETTNLSPAKPQFSISHFLVSSSYYLCTAWVQAVYTGLVQGGHTLGLCAGFVVCAAAPEYKSYALSAAKPYFTHLVVTSFFRQLTAVNQLLIPIIHTANKNNNKVNYLKSYLLLIPVRSPA